MNALAIALVLFGCSDDLSQCVQVRTERVASMGQCQAQVRSVLMSPEALQSDYPSMTAMCMSAKKASLIGNHVQDFADDWQ